MNVKTIPRTSARRLYWIEVCTSNGLWTPKFALSDHIQLSWTSCHTLAPDLLEDCQYFLQLCVVRSRRHQSISSHGHVLHHDYCARMARDPDPCRRSANTGGDLKEVVVRPCRHFPRLAPIGGSLELRGAAVGVDDLSGEPVLRNAGLHVNLEKSGDYFTGNVVPCDVDDAGRWRVERRKCIRVEVEVIGTAARALVNDLQHKSGVCYWVVRAEMFSDHSIDCLSVVGDRHTTTTISSGVPVRIRQRSAIQTSWEGVGAE